MAKYKWKSVGTSLDRKSLRERKDRVRGSAAKMWLTSKLMLVDTSVSLIEQLEGELESLPTFESWSYLQILVVKQTLCLKSQ